MNFLERLLAVLAQLRHSGRNHIICGDFNIAHKTVDTYSPARNSHVSGFFPEERAWMDALIERLGWVDAFRVVNQEPQRVHVVVELADRMGAQSRLADRLSNGYARLVDRVRQASIYKEARFSDHAPLTIDYDFPQ